MNLTLHELVEFIHEPSFDGFTWHFGMECYFNRKAKVLVSIEYLEHLTKETLVEARRKLTRVGAPKRWRFVFHGKISKSQRGQVLEKLK